MEPKDTNELGKEQLDEVTGGIKSRILDKLASELRMPGTGGGYVKGTYTRYEKD